MKNMQKLNKNNYKIILKRSGQNNKQYYRIVLLNRQNRYRMDLGSVNFLNNFKNTIVYINKQLLLFWINKGAFCSIKVQYFLNYILLKNM
jgi:ribosomal protein S16